METNNQIILIEDSESSFRYIQAVLRQDYQLRWIQNIEHPGLFSLLNPSPDLFIMDIGLPEKEMGFSLLKSLNQRFPDIPKIIITCYADATTAVRAFKLGAFDYIQKPFDSIDFKERISIALQHYNSYSSEFSHNKYVQQHHLI